MFCWAIVWKRFGNYFGFQTIVFFGIGVHSLSLSRSLSLSLYITFVRSLSLYVSLSTYIVLSIGVCASLFIFYISLALRKVFHQRFDA